MSARASSIVLPSCVSVRTRRNSFAAGSAPSSTTDWMPWRKLCPALSDAAIVISRSGSWFSNSLDARLALKETTQSGTAAADADHRRGSRAAAMRSRRATAAPSTSAAADADAERARRRAAAGRRARAVRWSARNCRRFPNASTPSQRCARAERAALAGAAPSGRASTSRGAARSASAACRRAATRTRSRTRGARAARPRGRPGRADAAVADRRDESTAPIGAVSPPADRATASRRCRRRGPWLQARASSPGRRGRDVASCQVRVELGASEE